MAAYGYQAVLELEGEKQIVLDRCFYTYIREINEKTGEVQSGVLGGTITLMYIDHPSDAILEWAMKYRLKNGSIKVRQTDLNARSYVPAEEVKLSEAACVSLDFDYIRHGSSHFRTQLTIASNESVVGDSEAWVSKKWKKEQYVEQAREKAKEVLGLNDTSVDAKLILNGKEYEIESFNIQFGKSFDYKGELQREVKGGLMALTINHVVDKHINHWIFHQSVKYSGSVVFAPFSRIASPVIVIEFVNGRCCQYTKNIGYSTVSYTILITAEEIKINGIEHSNNPELL
jgi:hypothetical protein